MAVFVYLKLFLHFMLEGVPIDASCLSNVFMLLPQTLLLINSSVLLNHDLQLHFQQQLPLIKFEDLLHFLAIHETFSSALVIA